MDAASIFAPRHRRWRTDEKNCQAKGSRPAIFPSFSVAFPSPNAAFRSRSATFRRRNVGFGRWNVAFGCRNLPFRRRNFEFVCRNPGFGCRNLIFRHRNPAFRRRNAAKNHPNFAENGRFWPKNRFLTEIIATSPRPSPPQAAERENYIQPSQNRMAGFAGHLSKYQSRIRLLFPLPVGEGQGEGNFDSQTL